MHFLIPPQINPMSMKETGLILIKLILFLTTFILIGVIYLKIEDQNMDYLTEVFLNKINALLESYAPFKESLNIN